VTSIFALPPPLDGEELERVQSRERQRRHSLSLSLSLLRSTLTFLSESDILARPSLLLCYHDFAVRFQRYNLAFGCDSTLNNLLFFK